MPEIVSRHERHDIRIVLKVMAQHGHDHLDLVAEPMREQRTDRAVDQAGNQRLLLGRPAFTLEEPARNAPGGEKLLLVVHGQREKIQPRLRRLRTHDSREHHGVAIGGHNGPIGLARDLAGLQNQGLAGPIQLFTKITVKHLYPLQKRRSGAEIH